MSNVVTQLVLPQKLERLASKLKDFLAKDVSNRQSWIEIQVGICLALAEARAEFEADIEFGRWCADNEFNINHQDRAAAIVMGRKPAELRAALEVTTKKSLRHIYEDERSRFTPEGKPAGTLRRGHSRGPEAPRVPQRQRAIDIDDETFGKFKEVAAEEGMSAAQKLGQMIIDALPYPTSNEEDDDPKYHWPCIPRNLKEVFLNKQQHKTIENIERSFTDRRSQRILTTVLQEWWPWMAR